MYRKAGQSGLMTGGNNRPRLFYRLQRRKFRQVAKPMEVEYSLDIQQALAEWIVLRQQTYEQNQTLMRTKAEFENYRKRAQRERQDLIKRANEQLILQLLSVMDNMERALAAADKKHDYVSLAKGVELIYNEFQAILNAQGLRRIESAGKMFDPHYHEAVGTETKEELEDNQIVDVLREGYLLRDKVIRPAMVRVNKKEP